MFFPWNSPPFFSVRLHSAKAFSRLEIRLGLVSSDNDDDCIPSYFATPKNSMNYHITCVWGEQSGGGVSKFSWNCISGAEGLLTTRGNCLLVFGLTVRVRKLCKMQLTLDGRGMDRGYRHLVTATQPNLDASKAVPAMRKRGNRCKWFGN